MSMMDLAAFAAEEEREKIRRLKKRVKELEDKEEKPRDIFEEMDGGSKRFESKNDLMKYAKDYEAGY